VSTKEGCCRTQLVGSTSSDLRSFGLHLYQFLAISVSLTGHTPEGCSTCHSEIITLAA